MDNKASFVAYRQSYLLYLWHMLEKHDLMVSYMQRLHESVASSNAAEGIPSVIFNSSPYDCDVLNLGTYESCEDLSSRGSIQTSAKKKAKTSSGQQAIRDRLTQLNSSLTLMTKTSARIATMEAIQKAKVRLSHAKKEKRNIMNQLYRSDSNLHVELESFLKSELKDLDMTIADIENELEELEGGEDKNATPKKRNHSLSVSS